MNLSNLINLSHKYGNDPDFVLAGGGNTSYKENGVLAVKGSGSSLATISDAQFVRMDIAALHTILQKNYPSQDAARESAALADMLAARLPGEEQKRPSVEAVLHALFPYSLVVHTHPYAVNALTCAADAKQTCTKLFGDSALWIELIKPGYVLSAVCSERFAAYAEKNGRFPQVVLLQNHGMFIAANTPDEIDSLTAQVMDILRQHINVKADFSAVQADGNTVETISATLKQVYAPDGRATASFFTNTEIQKLVRNEHTMRPLMRPLTPDHIVYCRHVPLFAHTKQDLAEKFAQYTAEHGFSPKIVAMQNLGIFALGHTEKEAQTAKLLCLDTINIAIATQNFGGLNPLPDEFVQFILNWEAESYRQKQNG